MSGGLDSTSIAALAHELLDDNGSLHAFSVVYDSLIPDNERHYSQLAADHIGIPITHISADKFSLFDDQTPGDMDQPEPFLISPLTRQFNTLLRLAANHGRIVLTGWDGDALMNESANDYFASAAKRLRLKQLTSGLAWYLKSQRRVPGIGIRGQINRMLGKKDSDSFYPEWIDESFAKRTNLRERSKETTSNERSSVLRVLASKLWSSLFEGYDPGATKLLLEVRHPIIDLRVIEFLLAIPPVPWCVKKHILRTTMQSRLPASVLNRHKTPLRADPALQMTRRASVRWLDSFEVSPQLRYFVNLDQRPSIADEQTSESLWPSLRVFALNYWLSNSQLIARAESRQPTTVKEPVSQTSIA
jgi:asparagine synthase (glutamine-hydrolysing)